MSKTLEDSVPLLTSRKGKGNEKRLEEELLASNQDARTMKLTVIPDTYLNVPPSPVTHPGESVWWLPAKRGTDKWLQCKKLNPQGTVSKQKTDKFLSPKVRAVKRFEPGSMNPSKPGHGIMLRLLNISSRRPDLFVRFYGWYEKRPGEDIFLAMEYFKDRDLARYKAVDCGGRPMEQGLVIGLTRKLLKGLVHLHKEGLANFNLRPEHILISNKKPLSVKIANFGISISKPSLAHIEYHNRYKAPEVIGILPVAITPAVDMWSLGCIVHEMLAHHSPFVVVPRNFKEEFDCFTDSVFAPSGDWNDSPNVRDLRPDLCRGIIAFEYRALQEIGYDETCRAVSFLKRLFVIDPAQRASAVEAMDDLWVFSDRELHSQLQQIGVDIDPLHVRAFLTSYSKENYIQNGNGLISALLTEKMTQDIGILVFRSVTMGFIVLTEMLLDVYHESQMSGGLHRPVLEYFRVNPRSPGNVEHSIQFQSFLQRAAGRGNLATVKLLLKRGVSKVNEPHVQSFHQERVNQIGRTALQAAAENGHLEVVRYLIKNGADVINDTPCIKSGRTALQAAVENGHLSVSMVLLENGADVNAPPAEYNGQTALNAARIRQDEQLYKILLEHGAKDHSTGLGCPEWYEEGLGEAAYPTDFLG